MWTTPWMTNTPFQVAWTWLKFTFHFMCLPSFLCWKSSICDFHSIWKYFMFLHSSWTNHRLTIHFYTTLRRGAPGDHGKKKKKEKRQVSFFRPTFILTMMQVLFLPLRHCSPCLTSIVLSAYVCCNTFVSAYHNVSKIIRGLILCWKLFFVCQTVILMFV